MSKRVTIVLEDDLVKELRKFPAKQIRDSTSSVSLSKVINEMLKKNLKN
ncbi:MAG: hypothetical protein KC444_01305 [Nitrosopumilus sp.]|nr:hypothetical protein [Nitrosopumilus sp.]